MAYGLRRLHLWQSATCPEYRAIENTFAPIAEKLPDEVCVVLGMRTSYYHSIQKVTRVAHGVGFVVAYAPMRGRELWIASTVQSLSADSGWGTRNKFKRLPLPEGVTVQELSAGREHVFLLTTKGEGAVSI